MKYISHILEIGVKAVLTSFAVVVSKSSTDPISFDKYLEWEHIASRGISKFVNLQLSDCKYMKIIIWTVVF